MCRIYSACRCLNSYYELIIKSPVWISDILFVDEDFDTGQKLFTHTQLASRRVWKMWEMVKDRKQLIRIVSMRTTDNRELLLTCRLILDEGNMLDVAVSFCTEGDDDDDIDESLDLFRTVATQEFTAKTFSRLKLPWRFNDFVHSARLFTIFYDVFVITLFPTLFTFIFDSSLFLFMFQFQIIFDCLYDLSTWDIFRCGSQFYRL